MIEYAICGGWGYTVEDAQQKLVIEVQRMINEGWTLAGGITGMGVPAFDVGEERDTFYFSQAIIRDTGSQEIAKIVSGTKAYFSEGGHK